MPEKVIFEYRAENGEGTCEFGFSGFAQGHKFGVFGPSIWAFCRPVKPREKSKQSRGKQRAHYMREALDSLERMYQDLFGEAKSDTGGDPDSD